MRCSSRWRASPGPPPVRDHPHGHPHLAMDPVEAVRLERETYRTRDIQLGRLTLCRLSYSRSSPNPIRPTGDTVAVLPLVVAFRVFGALFGVWQVLLPDLKAALGLQRRRAGRHAHDGLRGHLPGHARCESGSRPVRRPQHHDIASGLVMGLSCSSRSRWSQPPVPRRSCSSCSSRRAARTTSRSTVRR